MHVCPITSDAGSFADVVDRALSSERFCKVRANNPLLGIDKLVCNSELARNLNVIFKEQLVSLVSQLMLASHSCKDPEETQTEDSMHVT